MCDQKETPGSGRTRRTECQRRLTWQGWYGKDEEMKIRKLRSLLVVSLVLTCALWAFHQASSADTDSSKTKDGQEVKTKLSVPSAGESAEIQRLKKEIELLKKENQELRRMLAASAAPAAVSPTQPATTTPSTPGVSQALTSKWTISSTGKRHNSSCRYYGTGRVCGPNDGIACKICGG